MNYQLLLQEESNLIRRDFIRKFALRAPSHHCGYNGFYHEPLTERLRPRNLVSESLALELLANLPKVLVTWDEELDAKDERLNSRLLFEVSGTELAEELRAISSVSARFGSQLPDAICVFDRDLAFYLAFTHEYVQGLGNLCYTSYDVVKDQGIPEHFREMFDLIKK